MWSTSLLQGDGCGARYSSTIQPVCLPRPGTPVPANTSCLVSGWGKTASEGLPSLQMKTVNCIARSSTGQHPPRVSSHGAAAHRVAPAVRQAAQRLQPEHPPGDDLCRQVGTRHSLYLRSCGTGWRAVWTPARETAAAPWSVVAGTVNTRILLKAHGARSTPWAGRLYLLLKL